MEHTINICCFLGGIMTINNQKSRNKKAISPKNEAAYRKKIKTKLFIEYIILPAMFFTVIVLLLLMCAFNNAFGMNPDMGIGILISYIFMLIIWFISWILEKYIKLKV